MAFYQHLPQEKRKQSQQKRNAAWREEGSDYRNFSGNGSSRGRKEERPRKPERETGYPHRKTDRAESGRESGRAEVRSYGERRNNLKRDSQGSSGYSGKRSGEQFSRSDFYRPAGERNRTRQSRENPGRPMGDRNTSSFRRSERTADRYNGQEMQTKQWENAYEAFEYRPASHQAETPASEEREDSLMLTGRNPIREALKQHRDLEKLLVQKGELSGSAREIVAMAKEQQVLIQVVEKKRLDDIEPHHQGLIAFASAYAYSSVEEMLELARDRNESPFLVLLDGVTDPHNFGAVIRTAECAGAHGVIVPQHRSVGLTPAAVKASAGAIEHMKVARVMNLNRTIEELQQSGIWVYAVTMNGTDYEEVRFDGGTALVIGAEGSGISRLTEEKCDQSVSLPMRGHIESLNASVAAGIMMYHVLSARRKAGK